VQPDDGTDNAFVGCTTSGSSFAESTAERSSGKLGPGTYTVKVQYNTNGGTAFWLDDTSFVVQRIQT
jgi:hypothetical protein